MLTADEAASLSTLLRKASQELVIIVNMVDREVHQQGDFMVKVDAVTLGRSLKEVLDNIIDASALL